jgi:RloB-like protein
LVKGNIKKLINMPRVRKGVSAPKSKIKDTRRYFIIASEGADTERIYFEGLQTYIDEQNIKDRQIKIEFLKRETEKARAQSSHKSVIKQLDAYKKTYSLDERDELWLIIDRDKQNNPSKNIADIAQNCLQKGYFLALSNPNFEFWLLLHLKNLEDYTAQQLDDFLQNKKASASKSILEVELSNLLGGYNKSKYAIEKLLPHLQPAIVRAKALDTSVLDRWMEGKLGSRVYRLAEQILKT